MALMAGPATAQVDGAHVKSLIKQFVEFKNGLIPEEPKKSRSSLTLRNFHQKERSITQKNKLATQSGQGRSTGKKRTIGLGDRV